MFTVEVMGQGRVLIWHVQVPRIPSPVPQKLLNVKKGGREHPPNPKLETSLQLLQENWIELAFPVSERELRPG